MDIRHNSVAEKAALFKRSRVHVSDDELDSSELKQRQTSRNFFRTNARPSSSSPSPSPSPETAPKPAARTHETPRRVSSAPTPVQPAQRSGRSLVIKGTPASLLAKRKGQLDALLEGAASQTAILDETVIPDSTKAAGKGLQRSDSTPLPTTGTKRVSLDGAGTDSPSSRVAAAASKRRKRGPVSQVPRPAGDQVFRGLSFFYVPDNDIAPARRIRIGKAKEFGAIWTRTIATATHVVCDRAIRYKDLEGLLRTSDKSDLPVVVNEDYPIDCIQFKSMLDPTQKKYQVAGQPTVDKSIEGSQAPASSDESIRSLQLKPPPNNPRRWDYVPPAGTPSRSEASSQTSRVIGTPAPTASQPIVLDEAAVVSSPKEMPLEDEEHTQYKEGREAGTAGDVATEDELSQYITLMQEYKDLPLDADDDDDARSTMGGSEMGAPPSSDDQISSDEERSQRKKAGPRTRQKDLRFEDRFACNQAGAQEAGEENPNARTIQVLQSMADYYDRVSDHWRTTAYRKAIGMLKRMDVKISTEEEAVKLPMIGPRLAQKIEEIVTTDRLRRLEYAEKEPMNESLQLFMRIYGVGPRQAHQWIAQGYRTLDDLRQKARLSTNQQVGVDHYDDLVERIPRSEVEALGAFVKRAAAQIDPAVELIIGGSYRRGSKSSHDIDFIVTKPSTDSFKELVPFFNDLVQRLERENFLVARLASSRSGEDGSKWHGCCVLPKGQGVGVGANEDNGNDKDDDASSYRPIWRRIDFLLVPESEMGAALIYFTGNDIFNRSMRLLASKKGMRLNQRGLYKDVLRGAGRARVTEGELLEGRDERKIFEILDVQWRRPEERWC